MNSPRVSLIADTLWNGNKKPVEAVIKTFKEFKR